MSDFFRSLKIILIALLTLSSSLFAEGYDQYSKKAWTNSLPRPSSDNLFFQTNIGVGILYFSGVTGNLATLPAVAFQSGYDSAPIQGRLRYNRTPLYEYLLGYQPFSFLKLGLSYQHQGNVTVQTKIMRGIGSTVNELAKFSSNLALDALMLKIYGETPWCFTYRNTNVNAYLAMSFGTGWQSWTQSNLVRKDFLFQGVSDSVVIPFKQKVSTSITWGFDLGAKGRGATSWGSFSLVGGVKFNFWGQAKSIGKIESQDTTVLGLFKPFKIKTVYQWAPYLGAEWDFPNQGYNAVKQIKRRSLNPLVAKLNVGLGTLYFKRVRGNLLSDPDYNSWVSPTLDATVWSNAQVPPNITYNRTPLFEYLLLHNFNSVAQLGLSYQNQGGVTIQTQAMNSPHHPLVAGNYTQLSANLNLNALMLKGYLYLPQIAIKRACQIGPYIGFGFGPGWQSWSRINVLRIASVAGTYLGGNQPLHQKISANLTFSADAGLQVESPNAWAPFSMTFGCKFNYWGQARNVGLMKQQGNYKIALNRPLTIKKIHQWAPYLGVEWNFPNNTTSRKPVYVDGYGFPTIKPYLVSLTSVQRNKSFFTDFSAAIGFLYFSGVRGNLNENPQVSTFLLINDVPMRGRLSYSKSPLFEYQFGYQVFPWLKAALSYQHQGNISVSSQVIRAKGGDVSFPPFGNVIQYPTNQFAADLLLDALMAKVYFQSTKSILWLNFVSTPYLGIGTGISFQTWKRVELNGPFIAFQTLDSLVTPIRNKYCTNAAFMFDLGVKMQPPYINSGLAVTLGLKFNLWGQARNIGKLSQAESPRVGVSQPFIIKSVYQWAPYLGLQWNF